MMANKTMSILHVYVLWWTTPLEFVPSCKSWSGMTVTDMSLWLQYVGLRLGVLSPFCCLSISGVNGDCVVNEMLDVLPRTTISFQIHQNFVSNIFFEPCKKPFHLITNGDMKLNNAWTQMLKSISVLFQIAFMRKKGKACYVKSSLN